MNLRINKKLLFKGQIPTKQTYIADKVGLNSDIGVKELARKLSNEIKRPEINSANVAGAKNLAAD